LNTWITFERRCVVLKVTLLALAPYMPFSKRVLPPNSKTPKRLMSQFMSILSHLALPLVLPSTPALSPGVVGVYCCTSAASPLHLPVHPQNVDPPSYSSPARYHLLHPAQTKCSPSLSLCQVMDRYLPSARCIFLRCLLFHGRCWDRSRLLDIKPSNSC
jgi:hypothetical protein